MNKWLSFLLILVSISSSYGQINSLKYRRSLSASDSTWQKIVLPEAIYAKLNQNLGDVRIYGFTAAKDTVEASFLLESKEDQKVIQHIPFQIINTASTKEGYYYTLKTRSKNLINKIILDFEKDNFEWYINLEGSHDQKHWFTIMEDYRVLSIKNKDTDYTYTDLNFPKSDYEYYRIFVKSKSDPKLLKVSILESQCIKGSFTSDIYEKKNFTKERKNENDLIYLDLGTVKRINSIELSITKDFDYFRHIKIDYLVDSIKTEKGWRHQYKTLTRGILNSTKKNRFECFPISAQKLRITIFNGNNPALEVESIEVKKVINEIWWRTTVKADYYLYYGNKSVMKPRYDIDYFKDNIPDSLITSTLGKEEKVVLDSQEVEKDPLFESEYWIWTLMLLIIVLLGLFSMKMLYEKDKA